MPIYEYACRACGHQLETIQKMSDPPLTDCPECGRPELGKLISAAGFRLKGGGWYETDFKGGGQRNVAKSEDAKPKEAGGKDAGAKDAKSAKSSPGGSKPAAGAG